MSSDHHNSIRAEVSIIVTIACTEVDLYKDTVRDRSCWERLQPSWKLDYIVKCNRHERTEHH